jgi:gluconokinase
MASGTGIFNQQECAWDRETIAGLPIAEDQLSPVAEFSSGFRGLSPPYDARWPELAHLSWCLAIGDGAANNIGSGGTGEDRVVIMVGTSGALRVVRELDRVVVPRGLWSYRVDRRRSIQGGALSAGGNVYAWAIASLAAGSLDEVEEAVEKLLPDAHGLTVLPFLAGERSPCWNLDARSAIVGVTLDTHPADIIRALLESMSYRFGLVYDIVEREIDSVRAIIGSGAGLTQSPMWTQIMADVLGRPVMLSAVAEASSRGAALLVLESLGSISDISELPAPTGTTFAPRTENTRTYRAAMKRQQELYRRVLA